MQREGSSKKKQLRADKTWQTTSETVKYDDTYGMESWTRDQAERLPDTCTLTAYARNTATYRSHL
ncbi:hypothetical protein [Streptomyces virginiae]|uniref:hypothetical protein n=1 Tax=Streptomyces virginiae TaxID=1961 RepID=UPI003255FA61